MGNLLKLLSREDCPKYDVFVDFENAQPTDSEKETFVKVQEVLVKSKDILHQLRTYKGAGNEIREAITNSKNENLQIKAWQTVVPLVERLVAFYEFSLEIEKIVPEILMVLCSGNLTPREHLETQQAIVKQLAEILDFVLKFDDLKMNNPSIQNDLSYYRRTINRRRVDDNVDSDLKEERLLSNDLAFRMSLFYAQATPMLKVLSDTTTNCCRNLPIENTTETLSTMCQVCQRMIENPEFCSRFKKEETIFFVLRVMVGLIILFDHVHPEGAFKRSSHIDIKGSVKVLKEQAPTIVDNLLNALRYTTKHLNDENTPKQLKTLLA